METRPGRCIRGLQRSPVPRTPPSHKVFFTCQQRGIPLHLLTFQQSIQQTEMNKSCPSMQLSPKPQWHMVKRWYSCTHFNLRTSGDEWLASCPATYPHKISNQWTGGWTAYAHCYRFTLQSNIIGTVHLFIKQNDC